MFGRIVPDGRIRDLTPVSIAASRWDRETTSPMSSETPGWCRARTAVSRIIGIDRLDYTRDCRTSSRRSGFLDKYPQYQRQVVLTQIAPPTREDVEAYTDIRQQLESLAGSINGRFGELDWVPIHYIRRSTPRRRLGDIYRSSRICMVTPLRDGMNLVAKEYVAAQDPADPGVLILSQFAGAAEEMTEALIVNPYNIEETADLIKRALEMPQEERLPRYSALMAAVRKSDARTWARSFLSQLERVRAVGTAWETPEPIRGALEKLQQSSAPELGKTRRRTSAHGTVLSR